MLRKYLYILEIALIFLMFINKPINANDSVNYIIEGHIFKACEIAANDFSENIIKDIVKNKKRFDFTLSYEMRKLEEYLSDISNYIFDISENDAIIKIHIGPNVKKFRYGSFEGPGGTYSIDKGNFKIINKIYTK